MPRFMRRRTRSLVTKAQAKNFVRRRGQWFVSFNTQCSQFSASPSEVCPNGTVQALMTNQQLREQFGDSVLIRRIKGYLYLQPLPLVGPTALQALLENGSMNVYCRVGLRKDEVAQNQGSPQARNPLQTGTDDVDLGDYEDGTWTRLWEHYWPSFAGLDANTTPQSCCAVVTQPGYVVPPGESPGVTPGYTVPALSTECITCDVETQPLQTGASTVIKGVWRLPIDIRTPIRLKEDQSLNLWIGWESLVPALVAPVRPRQPFMGLVGGVRMFVEK